MFLLFIKQTMNRPINLVRGDRFLKQQRHFHQVDGGVGEIQSFCFLLILRDYRVTRRGPCSQSREFADPAPSGF